MYIAITDGKLKVFHTKVAPEFESRGLAKLLLNQPISYAQENDLKLIPLCPYVNVQFSRHPADYADFWFKE